MSSYNFDDDTSVMSTHTPAKCTQETTQMQQNISLFVEIMDSIKTDEEVKHNELLKELYSRQFTVMQENISILINKYQDNPDILASLLDLHDWMEGVLAQYTRRIGGLLPDGHIKSVPQADEVHTSDLDSDDGSDSASDSEDELALPARHKGKGKGRVYDATTTTTTTTSVVISSIEPQEEVVRPAPLKVVPGFKLPEGPGECPICCEEDVPTSDLFIFEACSHQFCRECLQGYFANLIKDRKVLTMTCPAPGCKTEAEHQHVQKVVTQDILTKYEETTFIASLNADPNVKWCPKPGCGNAIIGDPDNPRCQCTEPACRYEFCFLCSEPWHENVTCEQYEQWKADNGLTDKKFTKWAKENTKKCPKCKTQIEKMAGCNHMTCTHCHYQFCWLCGGKYTTSHFDVFNVLGCPGMQSGSKQFGAARRMGMRALIGTGLVLGGIIGTALAIPAAVVAGPIYGGYKLHQKRKRSARRRRYSSR